MKFKRLLAFLSAAVLMLSFCACSGGSKPLMTFRGTTLTTNTFSYMLSSQKSYMKYMFDYYNYYSYYQTGEYYFGTTDFDEYLQAVTEAEDGSTLSNAETMMKSVIDTAKMLVIVDELCKNSNLQITDTSALDEISSYIQENIDTAGDEHFLELQLAKYGGSIDIERGYLFSQQRTQVLYDYLYGDSGTQRLDDSLVQSDFNSKYKKFDAVYYPFYDSNEDNTQTIKADENVTDDDISAYFDENYVRFEHVLFYYYDVASKAKLDDDAINAKKASAEEVYNKIISGELSFDDAQEEYNEDPGIIKDASGICVDSGDFDEKVYAKAREINIGDYALVESEYGMHIILKAATTEADKTNAKEDVNEKLVIKDITSIAKDFHDKVGDGTISFESYKTHDSYAQYQDSTCYTDGSMNALFEDALKKITEINGTYFLENAAGIFILRKLATNEEDYLEHYDEVYDELAKTAYDEYIRSFYNEIKVDDAELAKYSFLTAEPIEINAIDPSQETSATN